MTRPISIAVIAATLALAAAGCDACGSTPAPPAPAPAAGRPDPVEAAKADYATLWHLDGKKIQGQYLPRMVQETNEEARKTIALEMQGAYAQLEARLRADLAKRYGAAAVDKAIEQFRREKGASFTPPPGGRGR